MHSLEYSPSLGQTSDVQPPVDHTTGRDKSLALPRPLLLLSALVIAASFALPFVWRGWVQAHYSTAIYNAADVPTERVALVLGAGLSSNRELSGMGRDRVETAVALYKAGKVQKLLMSGTNNSLDYDEPGVMMAYAVALDVPIEDIQPDYGGWRTYDSCYRAQAIFQVQSLVIVTQAFHLPRALFLCSQLGIPSVGVAADLSMYDPRSLSRSEAREVPATLVALLDVIRRSPPPVLGEPIPISTP